MTQLLKYKSGKMTALSVIVFTATIVAMLASCDTAQLEIPEVQLTLRLSLPEAGEYARTRAITADEENAIDIEQLKVLVFKVEGTSELFAYETPQIQLQANRYTVTLKQSQAEEKYRLVVIANAGKQLPAIQENTPKDEVLRKITFSASGNWNTAGPSDYTPFPMWGESATAFCHYFGFHHLASSIGAYRCGLRTQGRDSNRSRRIRIKNRQHIPD